MSYLYTVLGNNPVGCWPLDAASGGQFADASGNGLPATVISGVANAKPVVGSGVGGQLLSGSGFTIPISNLMAQNTQNRSFSYEWWIRPVSISAGSMSLFKRSTSGITMSGNSLTVTFNMSTARTITYNRIYVGNNYHCVVIYDGVFVALYVNDELIGTVEVTPADFSAGFTDSASTLSFSATGGYTAVLDSIAIYNQVLHNDTITNDYLAGTTYPDVARMSGFNNSHQYRIADAWATVFDSIYAADETAWNLGTFTGNATVSDDTLVNFYSDTTAQYEAGTWLMSLPIEAQALTLAGSRITWDANISNLTVDVSTDGGTTWSAATNGSSPIGALDLSTARTIVVRITFAAGASQTIVDKINLVLYTSKSIKGTNSDIPIVIQDSISATLAEFDYEPASFNLGLGVNLTSATNRMDVAADPVFGGYLAMEFLVYIPSSQNSKTVMTATSASPPTITTNASGQWAFSNITALYVDGVSIASGTTVSTGQWHHVIAVFASASGTFYFGNNAAQNQAYSCRIGYLATWFTAPTAAQVLSVYNAWAGTAPLRVTDSQTVTVAEQVLLAGKPVRAYSYNWSVSSGG